MEKQNTHTPIKIEQLYSDILRDYQIRLEKEEKVGRIPPNKSEDIIKRVKELLKENIYLLKTSYRALLKQEVMEEEERKKQEQLELENAMKAQLPDVKKEEDAIEDEFEFMEKQEGLKGEEQKDVQNEMVKKEENVSQESEQDKEGNREYQDTKKLRKHVLNNLDACFEGMFISSRKKYIAKSERTRFELDNVFIKFKDSEAIFKTITCDLNSIKTDEVKTGHLL